VELLAVVHALQKFRISVIGHAVTVYADNQASSFLQLCNLTSGRVTLWIMQLQEYDLTVVHISGANSFFADTLSRNPVGLSRQSLDLVRKPKVILVAKIDLGLDKNLKKELASLSEHQLADPTLRKIREQLECDPVQFQERYMIRHHVLCCKDNRTHPYWRAILEYRAIHY
jgi:hypothetical protein